MNFNSKKTTQRQQQQRQLLLQQKCMMIRNEKSKQSIKQRQNGTILGKRRRQQQPKWCCTFIHPKKRKIEKSKKIITIPQINTRFNFIRQSNTQYDISIPFSRNIKEIKIQQHLNKAIHEEMQIVNILLLTINYYKRKVLSSNFNQSEKITCMMPHDLVYDEKTTVFNHKDSVLKVCFKKKKRNTCLWRLIYQGKKNLN